MRVFPLDPLFILLYATIFLLAKISSHEKYESTTMIASCLIALEEEGMRDEGRRVYVRIAVKSNIYPPKIGQSRQIDDVYGPIVSDNVNRTAVQDTGPMVNKSAVTKIDLCFFFQGSGAAAGRSEGKRSREGGVLY